MNARLRCIMLVAAAVLSIAPMYGVAQSSISIVQIGTSTYLAGDPVALASRIPSIPHVTLVLSAISKCKGAQSIGFASTQRVAGGVVAWLPTSFAGCLDVIGGGPGEQGACFRLFQTPALPDPTNVSGGRTSTRAWVVIAATDATTCADLSTQVPGGVWARTTAAIEGLPAGSTILIKCQKMSGARLLDYVAPYSGSLPASKPAFWIDDQYVGTGGGRLDGVPEC